MQRCSYCGKEAEDKITLEAYSGLSKEKHDFHYCCEEHKEEICKFNEYVNKNAVKFIVLILFDTLFIMFGPIVGIILKNGKLTTFTLLLGLFIMGILILIYPFATPQTNSKLGLKRTIKLTRFIGLVFAVISGIVITIIIL